ncbi:Acylphosphatase [Microthyrium microscopicum]|uniref:Acylphosphatase n=1 Tax=Microthyrium microscopicum TaxID=703497 RepID=A0A6A6UI28_9PEZI|nr:Acylphosphatase [Microthyrium microscopicum]
MSRRIKYKVTGSVQGVNFRYYTAREANKIGVTGFVQNDDDGSVSGEAQGDDQALKQFLEIVKKGPPAADVSDVTKSDIDSKEGESKFNQTR